MTDIVKQFELCFARSPDAVLITDLSGKIIYVNHSWEKLTGYKVDEVYDKNPRFLSSGKTPNTIYKNIWNALLKGKTYTTDAVIDKKKNGKEYQIRAMFYPIIENEHAIYFVQVLHDITSKKQILTELQLHSLLLKKMQEGVCLVRVSDGVIVYTNPKFDHMLGYKKGELLNHHVATVNYGSPEEAMTLAKSIFNKLERYKKASYKIQNKKKDGSSIWCQVHTTEFIHADYGRVWVAVHEDITKEKHYQDKIKLSEKRLREYISQASDGIFIADSNGTYTYVNNIGCKMVGYSRREIKGQSIHDFLSEDTTKTSLQLSPFMKAESPFSELRLKKKDGTFLDVEVSAKILSDGRWLALVRDITEKKKMEQMKDTFLSMVSHELKTPITSIKAFSQLLTQSSTLDIHPKKIAYFAQHIEQQSNKLHILVSDLLHLGKIQSGRLTITKKRFDLNNLIKNCVINVQYTAEDHEIKQTNQFPLIIDADEERINQVLTNLLTNAVKYSPNGKKVLVTTQVTVKEIIVSVQDFGRGIDKDHLSKIFDSFYRVTENGNGNSMGLGLYIASEIIKKHNGRIWAESKIGYGSTFYFTLPNNGNN